MSWLSRWRYPSKELLSDADDDLYLLSLLLSSAPPPYFQAITFYKQLKNVNRSVYKKKLFRIDLYWFHKFTIIMDKKNIVL